MEEGLSWEGPIGSCLVTLPFLLPALLAIFQFLDFLLYIPALVAPVFASTPSSFTSFQVPSQASSGQLFVLPTPGGHFCYTCSLHPLFFPCILIVINYFNDYWLHVFASTRLEVPEMQIPPCVYFTTMSLLLSSDVVNVSE